MKKNTTLKFNNIPTIITYDLSNNDVSASVIASKSDVLYTNFSVSGVSYNLPNTTLCSTLKTAQDVASEFRSAFSKTGSRAKITKLLIVEVSGQNSFIENNE